MTDNEKVKAAREIINDGPNADNYTKLQIIDALGDLLSVIDKRDREPVVELPIQLSGLDEMAYLKPGIYQRIPQGDE